MTTPTPSGPLSGPYVYPERPYTQYPPLGYGGDQPPAPPVRQKSGSNAGKIAAVLVGAGFIAMIAGTIGGGVGYVVARETLPISTVAAATVADGSPSSVPGSIADIAAKVQPAVVQLNVTTGDGGGTGSGFVISADGYIVTNNHVVANATDIEVAFSDGKKRKAKLIGRDELTDIAFAVDSILAAIALVGRAPADHEGVHPKLWVIITGGILGVILMQRGVGDHHQAV